MRQIGKAILMNVSAAHIYRYTCIRIQGRQCAGTKLGKCNKTNLIFNHSHTKQMKNCLLILVSFMLWSCSATKSKGKIAQTVNENLSPSRSIHVITPGIPAYQSSKIDYKRSGRAVISISLSEPIVVSSASKPEKWGFFQFPNIARKPDGTLSIRWNLNADAMEAYGEHKFGGAKSNDGGKTWSLTQEFESDGILQLKNGDRISIHTPKPIKVQELKLPSPIGSGMDTYSRSSSNFYKLHDMPASRQGVFINRLARGESEWKVEQAALFDPEAARYDLRGQVPIVWWGDMFQLNDGSVIAGVYPGFYIDKNGLVDPRSGVFFYKSVDNGHSWKIQGRIPYVPDFTIDSAANKRMGFTEPTFEILSDGTFICVIRTTDGVGNGPMYISRSTDQGVTWTTPEFLAVSGVLPRLLQLKNGVTVLSSGRPGVQLRFSMDGKGNTWTDPVEMLPFINYKDQVSCGYTGLLATGSDRFLIVYSDFNFLNEAKEIRKAIKVREVIVTPK